VLFLFHSEKCREIFLAYWSEFTLKVIEELEEELRPCSAGMEEGATYLFDTGPRLDHLNFSDIISPSVVSEELSDLTTKLENLIE